MRFIEPLGQLWVNAIRMTIVPLVVSLLVIRFLMSFIRKHDFKPFGWYRIVLGVVVIAYFALLA